MTAELFGSIVGILITVVFLYMPKVNKWFYGLPEERRPLVVLGFDFLTALLIFGGSCANTYLNLGYNIGVTCDYAGVIALVRILIATVTTGQSAYLLGKGKAKSIKAELEMKEMQAKFLER